MAIGIEKFDSDTACENIAEQAGNKPTSMVDLLIYDTTAGCRN